MVKYHKIIGISGSPRDKNTNFMLKTVLDATDCDYELILLKDKKINSCKGCGGCYYTHKCIMKDDMQEIRKKLEKADVIILGSPAYFANVTGLMKNFIDRCLPLYLSEKLKKKKVALISVGNFRKGEIKLLDNFNPEKAIKTAKGRRLLKRSIVNCIDIMKRFCVDHMGMNIVGSVIAINSDPKSKKNDLIKLGRKLIE